MTSPATSSSLTYRAEIDGLRAIAVAAVIWFHAELPGARGGFVGVDIFFVISGYLITSLIASDLRQGKFSIANFYERRARRILPALYTVMAGTFVMAYFVLSPSDMRRMATSDLFVLGFLSNFHFWWKYDYFDAAANLRPMLHTWSLAVEEQFYVLFPVLLVLLRKKTATTTMIWLCTLATLSFASIFVMRVVDTTAPFYLLPARAWELLVGAICVFLPLGRIWSGFSLVGILTILASIVALPEATTWPSIWTMLPVLGTALVLLTAQSGTFVHGILSARPLVLLGLASYSAYLWHFPLLAMARHLSDGRGLPLSFKMVAVLLTLVLAFATWKLVEQPWRNRNHLTLGNGKLALSMATTVTIALAATSLWGRQSGGWPSRIASEFTFRVRTNTGIGDICASGVPAQNIKACQTGDTPSLVLWGDSFAMHLFSALQTNVPSDVHLLQLTYSTCIPMPGYVTQNQEIPQRLLAGCMSHNENSMNLLRSLDRKVTVVLSSAFWGYFDSQTPIIDKAGVNQRPNFDLTLRFRQVIEDLKSMGHRVIVVSPLPIAKFELQQCQLYRNRFGQPDDYCDFPLDEAMEKRVAEAKLMQDISDIAEVVWLDPIVCPEGKCRTYRDGIMIYRDSMHFSYEGSEWLGKQPKFRDVFANVP